jgi:hypothetical protein
MFPGRNLGKSLAIERTHLRWSRLSELVEACLRLARDRCTMATHSNDPASAQTVG